VPHIRGFPLLGWQLARAESTSRPAPRAVQSANTNLCRRGTLGDITGTLGDITADDSQDSLHNSHWLEMQRRNNQTQTRC
jgi:hypothetical protein